MTFSKENELPMPVSKKVFPFYRFKGTHRQIGQQFGEACSEQIKKHLHYALQRLASELKVYPSLQSLEEIALQYREYVLRYTPFLDEEIQGVAEGAGISLGEAYFLQLRAEMYQHFDPTDHECTTFAVLSGATKYGSPLIGQNVDLHSFYIDCYVVIEIVPDEGPASLMLTPAGQVSFVGINNQGLGIFGNFITCDGWRVGFPRYLYSRLALTKSSISEVVSAMQKIYRASSRNLILIDKEGKAVDIEVTPSTLALVEPKDSLLAHSNHFVAKSLLHFERKKGDDLENSQTRLKRMRELMALHKGNLSVKVMKDILRDRETAPHTLCRMPGDFGTGTTSASVIAEPSKGQLWIAVGPPNEHEYICYSFSRF